MHGWLSRQLRKGASPPSQGDFASAFVTGPVGLWLCAFTTVCRAQEEVAEFFEAELTEELHPRYNIAPSQLVFVIRQVGLGRTTSMMRWAWFRPGLKILLSAPG